MADQDSADKGAYQHLHRAGPVHDTHMFTIPNPRAKQPSPPLTRDSSPSPDRQASPKPTSTSSSTEPPTNTNSHHNDTSNNTLSSPDPESKPKQEIKIPKITPIGASSSGESPQDLAQGLVGKYVDEFGNILDWDGTVLGRVEGDLPSMVGRPVSETGEILDEEGEVAGHVSENHTRPPLKPLDNGLKVDEEGNIYGEGGKVIGKLNNKDPAAAAAAGGGASSSDPKPAGPSPSDVFLDVKSTHDGIQLIIRIPTVFNRGCDHCDHSSSKS